MPAIVHTNGEDVILPESHKRTNAVLLHTCRIVMAINTESRVVASRDIEGKCQGGGSSNDLWIQNLLRR